jgi:hypothetical protein
MAGQAPRSPNYRKPPVEHQFKKGQSGNLKGRPKKMRPSVSYGGTEASLIASPKLPSKRPYAPSPSEKGIGLNRSPPFKRSSEACFGRPGMATPSRNVSS